MFIQIFFQSLFYAPCTCTVQGNLVDTGVFFSFFSGEKLRKRDAMDQENEHTLWWVTLMLLICHIFLCESFLVKGNINPPRILDFFLLLTSLDYSPSPAQDEGLCRAASSSMQRINGELQQMQCDFFLHKLFQVSFLQSRKKWQREIEGVKGQTIDLSS